MNKRIYLIRHGETDYNKKGMVQGSGIDASLNDTGRAQGAAFYERYREMPFDKVFISKLVRTKETVQGFIDDGLPYEVVDGLEEISWGDQEGVPFTPETSTAYQIATEKWANGEIDTKIAGGESPVDVMNRQKKAIAYILNEDWETALICCHGRAMRIMLCWILGKPLSEMDDFGHSNTGLYVLDYENGNFSLETHNDIAHLEVLAK
ncbi:histidine phosphatase family protein [Marinoscillum sp. MHG1-6]|uniref:histidine phosphatase family protein n=1 Tax=Marinoscillum sp. MHG1-6 TaxID=2959627 RepID=UPI00280BC2A0|nr:histidine phosphatase family protein [Marinoscillum sp. MHG1-6]